MTIKIRYGSLSARLIVSILLIIFVPSFVGLAFLGIKTRNDFRQQAITHLKDGLEITSISTVNRLELSKASLRLTTTRVKKDLEASLGLALRLSLGEVPKEWHDDKLYRQLYNVLKNDLLKLSGITEARIINSSGNELIRLIQTPSGIEEKAPGELENKSHRNYFKNTMALPGGGIHIHPITLQKEYKKIVRPLMPVLRMGGKITLSDEVNFGVVLFNIKSEYIFGMRTSQKKSGFVITDENGYYLVHPDEKALWGNELGIAANLFNDEPDFRKVPAMKDALLNTDSGIQRSQHHDDYHAWQKIRYDESNPSRYWLLFQREGKGSIEASWERVVKVGFAGFAMFMLIGFGALAIIVSRTLRPLTEVADAMKRLEDGDLTVRADVRSMTEIGRITHAFNSMADWLEKYRSELQKSLAISSAMSDTAPNAHIVIKQDGKIVSANKATERIFGYPVDKLAGKDIKTLMPKPYNEKEEDYVWDELDMGIERVVGFGMKELNAMRNDGEVFRVSVYLGSAKIGRDSVFIAVISDISERKHSEAALLENEEKYRNLFESANDAIYLIDPVTAKIIDCNQKAAEMVGYSIDELKEMTLLDLHPKEELSLIPEQFKEIMKKGSGTHISNTHHKRKDGSLIAVEVNASVIKVGNKKLNLSVVRDVTVRKDAEGDLHKRNQFIKLLQEVSSQANESQSIDDTLRFCLEKVRALTSWPVGHVYIVSPDNPDILKPTDIWSQEDGERFKVFHDVTMRSDFLKGVGLIGKVLATGKPAWIFDVTIDPKFLRAKAAREVGIKAAFAFPVLVGNSVPAVLEFFSPETMEPDEQLLEIMAQIGTQTGRVIERQRAEEKLLATSALLEKTFASLNEAVFVVDPVTRTIISSNPAIEPIFGYTEEEVFGRNTEFLHVDRFSYEKFGEMLFQALNAHGVFTTDYKSRRKDGTIFLTNHTVTEIKDDSGKRTALVSVIRDITEQKRAEDELKASETKYRTLMDNASDAIGITDINGTILEVNGQMEKLTGYTKKELVGRKFPTLLPKSVAGKAFKSFKNTIAKKVSGSLFDGAVIRKDGSEVPIEVTSSRVEYEGRQAVQSSLRDITDRKRYEDRIVESEKKLSAILNNMQDTYYRTDNGGIITMVSPSIEQAIGWKPEEVIGTNVSDHYVNPDDRELFYKKLLESGGRVRNYEIRMKRKDGSTAWVSTNAQTLLDKNNNIIGVEGTSSDITKRKRTEQALDNIAKGVSAETGDEFFRSLVRYLAKTLDAAYAFVGELTGEKSNRIKTIAVCVDGEVKDNFEYELAGTPCINVVGKAICVYPDKVQQQFPKDHMLVEMGVQCYIGTPLFDSKGNALGLLVVMDRKPLQNRSMAESMLQIFATRASAELERKLAEEALRISEEKHRAIFEQASDSIVIIDPEKGEITAFNDRAHENLGYTRKEFQKLGIADIELIESMGALAKHFEKVIKEKSDIFETRHRKKSGEIRDVLVNTKSISIGSENFLQGVWSDITERKRAEDALKEAKQAAEKANEAKTRFVAKANHELRNPLTSMISMLKLIVSDMCESREQEKEFIKNVYNSSIHLRGLIEHLLDLTVIESGKLKMNMRAVRLDNLLELVRQITWIRAKEKGLELTFACDCEEGNLMIYCDPDRLRELLVNLVNNAIKFTEKGSVRVACTVTHDGEARTLEIIDSGIGIEPDKLKEVFDPFVQAEGHRYGGAGLGLTLAKKMVVAMGGTISIKSKGLGHGTKVTLSLPQAPVENKKRKK